MNILKLKYFYTFGIFLLLLNFSYAVDSVSQHNIPVNISTLIENGKQENAIILIVQTLKKNQANLLKIKKTDVLKYTSFYDEISALMIVKNKLLMEMQKEDAINTDEICNFILDYEEVEFIKTQFYKTPFHDDVAKTVQNIASLYEQCHPLIAEKYLKSVVKIKENIYGKESIEAAKAHDMLGDYYRIYMADFKEAIKEYEEAKRIREKLYGVDDPRTTENYAKLTTSIYYHGDKTNRAEKLLLDSIAMRKKSSVNKDLPLYGAYMDMGIYYSMKNEYAKSVEYLLKALKSFQGKVNSNYIVIISELSQNYLNQNDLYNALIYAKEVNIKAREFYKERQHPQVVESFRQMNVIIEMIDRAKSK